MENINLQLLRKINCLLTGLLAIIGFSCGENGEIPCEYGSPHANFQIKGKVTDMKGKKNDYRAFLKKSGIKAREGKQVYISLANHSVITEITYLLGKGNLTIADYLDNVLNEHFQTHRAEINRMLDSVPKVEL